ncbi:MAG: hypothetical protein Q8O89_06830, partial [Nanoarchaeota archaeon]|nr:hypothetical protein [Nanoarchaeota archaeon]
MDQKLVDYIKASAKKGHSHSEIEDRLIAHGWKKSDIKQAINSISYEEERKAAIEEMHSRPAETNVKSSYALMFVALLFAVILIGTGFFYVSKLSNPTGLAVNEKQPYVEQAKDLTSQRSQQEQNSEALAMQPYKIDFDDWTLEESSDKRITKLTKNSAAITISELNSNGKSLIDYFDMVKAVVLNIDSQNGNRLLEASDRTINGKKAKTMLRQYDKDGKTMKLL